MTLRFVLFLAIASPAFSATKTAVVFSKTIGSVGEAVFTSREASLSGLMDRLLAGEKDPGGPSALDTPASRREQSSLLLEEAVAREAASFAVGGADEKAVADLVQKADRHIATRADWKKLSFSPSELRRIAERKLAAKSLVRLRSESMKGLISDVEAQAYFEKNRVKFGSLPFASFKNNIKTFLAQQQLEERLRSWFEILRRKYKVREDTGDDLRG